MAVTVDDIVEAAANGVIRALEARKAGQSNLAEAAVTTTSGVNLTDLVSAGFFVSVTIRAGGIPGPQAIEQVARMQTE
jgi:hypothetical protein